MLITQTHNIAACGCGVIHKARLPAYVDGEPEDQAQEDTFEVARRFEPAMAAAYGVVFTTLWDDEIATELLQSLTNNDVVSVAASSVPFYNPGEAESEERWKPAFDRLKTTYSSTVRASKVKASDELGVLPATVPLKLEAGLTIAPDSRSFKWIETRTAEMVVAINSEQRTMVEQIIRNGYGKGLRPKELQESIGQVVGLTPREAGWVEKRRLAMIAEGLGDATIKRNLDAFSERLLKQRGRRIARTETKAAQEQGRSDLWEEMQETNVLGVGVMKEWISFVSPRTSDICLQLDGQQVPVGQSFFSEVLGAEVNRPPAHPNCRSTMRLVNLEEA